MPYIEEAHTIQWLKENAKEQTTIEQDDGAVVNVSFIVNFHFHLNAIKSEW
jgi:S-adenosylmethionine synthetase